MNTEGAAATIRQTGAGLPVDPQEMDSAGRVQARLSRREHPRLETLEFAGLCLPRRAVGGDFYDFLEPAPGRLALVLGDVSGHGVPAALMMAALQASLRTHYAVSAVDLGERIEFVNRLLYECTAAEHYAGLFVGEYDDGSGRLRYANCGHVPPLLVRDDRVERLRPTGSVLGVFEHWGGAIEEVMLGHGDVLALVTDGIIEATDAADAEFGELRLLSTLLRYRHLPPESLARAVSRDVRLSCRTRPIDDATILVARVRGNRAGQARGGDGDG